MTPTAGRGGSGQGVETRRSTEFSASRMLLRRLVEVVAEPVHPQQRLDRIVELIASNRVADVCSVYFNRAGETLELFATVGLAREAVHQTRMRVGEGLVGTIAAQGKVINTADAQMHPNFMYFPETGEEIYQSFLGVPILRAGRVVGVLTVQNRAQLAYGEEEIEAIRRQREEAEQRIILGRAGEEGEAAQNQAAPARPAQGGPGPGQGAEERVVHQGGTFVRTVVKVGRNDVCPCGSGKKFKKCHEGREAELQVLMSGGRPPSPVARA